MTTLREKLLAQADGLLLMAEAADVLAAHFRPRYLACWKDDKLVDVAWAGQLRYYVSGKEAESKQYRREAAELQEAVEALPRDDR